MTIADVRTWTMLDHVCRHCMGRLLQTDDVLMCAQCGKAETVAKGAKFPTFRLCCCGLSEPVGSRRVGMPHRQPFRCVPNPRKTEENSAEITCAFGDLPAESVPV